MSPEGHLGPGLPRSETPVSHPGALVRADALRNAHGLAEVVQSALEG